MVSFVSFDDTVLCRIMVGVGPTDQLAAGNGGARLQTATANGRTPYSGIPVFRN